MSSIPDIDAFNLWIENDTSDIEYFPQSNDEQEAKPVQSNSVLRNKIHALKKKICARKCELDLALAEQVQIRQYIKKRTVKSAIIHKKIGLEQRQPIRINGVSKRCGSYTNIMRELSLSPFLGH